MRTANGDLNGEIHVDHIQPLAGGGTSERDNLQAVHSTCNLRKGARSTE